MTNEPTKTRTRKARRSPTRTPRLTPKEQRFVAEYLECLNGAKAARRAGYEVHRADNVAYDLLRKPEIKKAVDKGKAEQLAKADVNAVRTLETNRRIADVDVRDFFDATANLRPVSEWTPEMGAVVASIEVVIKNAKAGDGVTDTIWKIKFWNKNQALELMFKHLQLLQPEPPDPNAEPVPCFIMPPGTKVAIQ